MTHSFMQLTLATLAKMEHGCTLMAVQTAAAP